LPRAVHSREYWLDTCRCSPFKVTITTPSKYILFSFIINVFLNSKLSPALPPAIGIALLMEVKPFKNDSESLFNPSLRAIMAFVSF